MDKDAYVRRVVSAANRFFYKKFISIPYGERTLFLPYCLRARGCPTEIDPERGLVCGQECVIPCRLREVRDMALSLGYRDVFIVVSGRLHKRQGMLRSRDFLVRQVRQGGGRAVIGCLCAKDFREKYLRLENVSRGGILEEHGRSVVPQICLLRGCSCLNSSVDWRELEALIRATV